MPRTRRTFCARPTAPGTTRIIPARTRTPAVCSSSAALRTSRASAPMIRRRRTTRSPMSSARSRSPSGTRPSSRTARLRSCPSRCAARATAQSAPRTSRSATLLWAGSARTAATGALIRLRRTSAPVYRAIWQRTISPQTSSTGSRASPAPAQRRTLSQATSPTELRLPITPARATSTATHGSARRAPPRTRMR